MLGNIIKYIKEIVHNTQLGLFKHFKGKDLKEHSTESRAEVTSK